jgi:hypothetical protein
MKKKYFAPEMEEIKVDEPVVLDTEVQSSTESGVHNEEGGESL